MGSFVPNLRTMKRLVLMGIAAMFAVSTFAQTKPKVDFTGDITSDMTFSRDTMYELHGLVYVKNNATLTIESGTVVLGGLAPDNSNATALVVYTDGKINAVGTPTQPIIFTSAKKPGEREYGDWGGVVLMGKAPINKVDPLYENGVIPGTFGGNEPAHSSGTMKYCRIEFAGYPFEANRELNSLTLCAIGSGTTINHIQCSFNNDDAYEWFGGTVNMDHLIAYRTNDDDYDVDNGFSGHVQFGVSLSDTAVADVSTKNGFEVDNDANGSTDVPITAAVFSNMTIIGAYYDKNFVDQTGNHGRGAHIRRNCAINIFNTVWIGWKEGNRMDGDNTMSNYANGIGFLQHNMISGCITDLNVANGADLTQFTNFINDPAQDYRFQSNTTDAMLMNPYSYSAPDWTPKAGSPLLNGANFSNSKLASFTQTTYIGAFDQGDNWAEGWTEFDPKNAVYDQVLGLDNIDFVKNINVYPNPTTQKLSIEFDLATNSDVTVQVLDLSGKVVATPLAQTELFGGAQSVSADLGGLNNGVYFVVVKTSNGVQTAKVVLNR
ncbi:MAG: T9SS type A sorting domain-containing protein [Bacteroidetes bacterium]|nr:T9SS type A sorting domain-containing protein [Bacteroidota bacterium]